MFGYLYILIMALVGSFAIYRKLLGEEKSENDNTGLPPKFIPYLKGIMVIFIVIFSVMILGIIFLLIGFPV
jgi:hypothetical protein